MLTYCREGDHVKGALDLPPNMESLEHSTDHAGGAGEDIGEENNVGGSGERATTDNNSAGSGTTTADLSPTSEAAEDGRTAKYVRKHTICTRTFITSSTPA